MVEIRACGKMLIVSERNKRANPTLRRFVKDILGDLLHTLNIEVTKQRSNLLKTYEVYHLKIRRFQGVIYEAIE